MDLSIIIAAYNVETYIEKCVASCIQDSGAFNYEIVVVNDGSTDGTSDLLIALSQRIHNLKIVNQSNSGLGAARNKGLENAAGRYLWFIDGDDYLQENVIQSILIEIADKNLDTLILNYAVVNEQYEVQQNHGNKPENIEGIVTGSDYYETNYSKSYTWLFVFKKSLFIDNGILFKERINMQDSEILPKLMYHTKRLFFFDSVCYYYVQQANSFTNSAQGEKRYKYFESIVEVATSLQEFLKTVDDSQIAKGIEKKVKSLDEVIFNHLVFFNYEPQWFKKIIALLRETGFYPLRYDAKGKMKLVKSGLNIFPAATKNVITIARKFAQ